MDDTTDTLNLDEARQCVTGIDIDAATTNQDVISITDRPTKRQLEEDDKDTLQETSSTINNTHKIKKKKARVHIDDNITQSDKSTTPPFPKSKKPGRKALNKSMTVPATASSLVDKNPADTTVVCEDPWKSITPPEPESDPETSLDRIPDIDKNGNPIDGSTTTVHWDPQSSAGQKVGYRVRIYQESSNQWKSGRILRYDPISHKYKVDFTSMKASKKKNHHTNKTHEEWIDLKDCFVYMSGRFVWALVKGYAWWPAQVLTYEAPIQTTTQTSSPSNPLNNNHSTMPRDIFSEPPRDGYLLVEFFDSGEVAYVRDSPESIRPFSDNDEDHRNDPIMKKNKKRTSPAAIEYCKQEKDQVRKTRNAAVKFYARKAFAFAKKRAHYLLGRKIQLFRRDLNYPLGEHVFGTIRQYSCVSKKWLVVFDPWPTNKAQYDPGWFNFLAKDVTYTFVDKLKPVEARNIHDPTDLDLIPYLFGFEQESSQPHTILNPLCVGCLIPLATSTRQDSALKCVACTGQYHPGCLDPLTLARLSQAKSDDWMCHKCIPCLGCKQRDIAFGIKTIPSPPPSLNLKFGESLDLCSSCTPLYENKMFCPVCTHVWNDVIFQKVQKRLLWNAKMKNAKLPHNKRLDLDLREMGIGENPKPDWFYPETRVWGYTESTMVQCDMCNLWVHAGCANLTKEEYEKTILGSHPIYSKEYLCRVCCKKRCLTLMEMLQNEDSLFLFANPVTDQMALNYHDIIKNPMDISTMFERVEREEYCNYAWIRESFELMVYNAMTFNRPFTKFWNEARRFYESCITKIFNIHGKAAPPSTYENLIKSCISRAFSTVQAEIDREQTDATAEKKDALAGAQVVNFHIGPLSTPVDPKSCIYFTEIRLSSVDGFFSCWLECCFICGSSGAMDTLLYCVDCGEAFHSFCVNVPIQSMTAVSLLGWRCPNCKVCEISGNVPIDDSKLLMCEMCDRAFSIDLINPPLTSAPKAGLWICSFCVDCKYCHNLSGDVDRTMWSMLPDVCYRCGGAAGGDDGLLDIYKCSVCNMFSLPTDADLSLCCQCKKYIHKLCAFRGDLPMSKSDQFYCLACCEQRSQLIPAEYVQSFKEETLPKDLGQTSSESANAFSPDHIIDDIFPSDELLQMIAHVRSRISQTPMINLDLEKHSEWIIKARVYSLHFILEDALILHQIIRSQCNTPFHMMLSQQLEKDCSSIPSQIHCKSVRFACFLRVREKRQVRSNSLLKDFSQAMLRKYYAMDMDFRSVLTNMACSYICAGCILFGLDINIFFPYLAIQATSQPLDAPVSILRVDDDYIEDPRLFTISSYPGIGTENLSSASSVDLNRIAEMVTDLKPNVDDPVESLEFNDAVLALFQMSHQLKSVESNTGAPSCDVEDRHLSFQVGSFEQGYDTCPNKESIIDHHEHEHVVEGYKSLVVDTKQADGEFQVDCVEDKIEFDQCDEENSLSVIRCNGLDHSGLSSTLRLDKSATTKTQETTACPVDIGQYQVFELSSTALNASECSSYENWVPALPASDKNWNKELVENEMNGDDKSNLVARRPCGSENPVVLEGNVSGYLISEGTLAERRLSETSYPLNVENSHINNDQISTKFRKNAPSPAILSWNSKIAAEVNPMIGWGSFVDEYNSNVKEWKDTRMCCLCMTCGDDDAGIFMGKAAILKKAGRLLPFQGSWVHVECALWSSEVWKNRATGELYDVHKARSRGLKLKCCGCGRVGATVGCHKIHCKSNYHFACAAACGAIFTSSGKVYCFRHKDVPNDCAYEKFNEVMECLKVDHSDIPMGPESDDRSSIRIGALTVHTFGHIDQDSDQFHSKNYIYPEGFTSSRIFWSSIAPKKRTLYIMNVSKSTNGKALFSIRAADSEGISYRGTNVKKVYEDLIRQVLYINQAYFSLGEKDSIYPVHRSPKCKAYGLNGPQFFGFGLDTIRRVLERSAGAASSAVPLSDKSESYRFCFIKPTAENVTAIQRKRALLSAEKSLQNPTGCARAEGMNAVHKSVGSGRITRALVRRAEDETNIPELSSGALTMITAPTDDYSAKYHDLKTVPFEEKLVVKRSHIHGWGLFAKIGFPRHSMIIEYMGETIRQGIADIREREYEDKGIGSCYMFRLDFERIVDATTIGCMARFMNHSCSPNCYAKVIHVTDDLGVSDKKIIIFASKEISAGDEITYDYKFPVEDGSLRCSCGAPNCIGRMN